VYGGDVQYIADQWHKASGKEFIIVIPDGGNYWYMNDYQGVSPYEDYFMQELIPSIEKTYRVRTERSGRFIAGLSMGGHGSLHFSVKYPKLFSKCYAMSPGIFTNEDFAQLPPAQYKKYGLTEVLGDLQGQDRITDLYKKNMLLEMIQTMSASDLKMVKFFVDCGDDDFLLVGNMALMQLMRAKEMNAEFRIRDGAHNWIYWKESLRMALPFFSE
jgi:S-formylglutathione hydrolase FrmB